MRHREPRGRRASARVSFALWLVLGGCAHGAPIHEEASPTPAATVPSRVRRLSNAELERTIDLALGIRSDLARGLPPDVRQDGYTIHTGASISSMWATRWARMAPELARTSLEHGWAREAQGAPAFVELAVSRLFRRSPTPEELSTFTRLHAEAGPSWLLATLMQSPQTLYVHELGEVAGGPRRLSDDEVASALAYAVWGGPPDEDLMLAAKRGELRTADARERHARRLLARDEARHHFRRFVLEWLEVDTLEDTTKHPDVVPGYDAVKAEMLAETRAFVDEIMVHTGGSIAALLAGRFTSIGPAMAQYYGLPPDAHGPRIGLAAHGRVGVLQHASFLSAHAHPDSPSPVKRGDFVLRRLLCTDLPRPSELDLQVVIPPAQPEQTTRERFAAHVEDPACQRCHKRIDPLGFVFESFDAGGRWRTVEHGRPITTAVQVRHRGETRPFADSRALSEWLASSPEVHGCVARHFFRYLSGQSDRAVEREFEAIVARLEPDARQSLVEILLAYVRSELFVLRSEGGAA